jgi:hypothetical protein
MSRRASKKKLVRELLRSGEVERVVAELGELPGRGFMNPLRAALCSDERAKWHAITAIGILTRSLADRDLESARVVMRTLMWNLTEESGGIAWGVPEAMAEIMACHEALAQEYSSILVSYTREEGNFLEYEPLQRGAIWGIGRLAQIRPELLLSHQAGRYLLPYLESADAEVRGLAVWALGLLGEGAAADRLDALRDDPAEVKIFLDRKLVKRRIGDLADEALGATTRQ